MGAKDFSDPDVAKNTDANWIEITKKGKGKMPAYDGKLTDTQIQDLIKFARTLAK
jgi:mono/diheme cytochrome c family protein